MLEILSKGFQGAKAALTGKTALTAENIESAMREIRVSLLEADVDVQVVKTFLERVKNRALGEVVQTEIRTGDKKFSRSPGEHFVLICHHELEKLMGETEETPIVYRRPYSIIMLVGLQGTGKTTTAGKLASYLIANKRKPLLVAADIYRPAAVEQLKVLGQKLDVPVYAQPGLDPVQLCTDALREARQKKRDVVIFDTAGRLAIDEPLMAELDAIKQKTRPDNVFLVVDAMSGQDALRTATEFNRRLDVTGFVMTKLDGDARGGAALSIREVTGKPIKFLGMGEGLEKLEAFRAEGLASRILGMGDVVGLMKDFEAVVDAKQAERDTKKLLRGDFTLDDFLNQLKMIKKIGSVKDIYEKFPIFGDQGLPEGVNLDDNAFVSLESLIQSMTLEERRDPSIIDTSRANRIAKGAGRKPEQVTDLVTRFGMMHQMMANLSAQPGLLGMLPGFKQLSQLRQMKGMGMQDMFGDITGSIRGMAQGRPATALPGMPQGMNMPATPGAMGGMMPQGFPAGMQLPPGFGQAPNVQRRVDNKLKEKARAKRKAEKKARKKSRRR